MAKQARIRTGEDFLREFMPKEYERRKKEGRCMTCGAKRRPSPFRPWERAALRQEDSP